MEFLFDHLIRPNVFPEKFTDINVIMYKKYHYVDPFYVREVL